MSSMEENAQFLLHEVPEMSKIYYVVTIVISFDLLDIVSNSSWKSFLAVI
jgi:hypothetical protein